MENNNRGDEDVSVIARSRLLTHISCRLRAHRNQFRIQRKVKALPCVDLYDNSEINVKSIHIDQYCIRNSIHKAVTIEFRFAENAVRLLDLTKKVKPRETPKMEKKLQERLKNVRGQPHAPLFNSVQCGT